jgi:DNA-binding beta-propeller fold protein YncE
MPRSVTFGVLSAAALVVAASLRVAGAGPAKVVLGNGTLYMGAYSGDVLAVDEATEKTSLIHLKTGYPYSMRVSDDTTRLFALAADMEHFEVVDTVTRQSVDAFTLSEANKKVRVLGYAVDPQQRYMALGIRAVTKLADRFKVDPSMLAIYDLGAHKVVKTVRPPGGGDEARFNLRYSPDGRLLYLFGREVLILDASTLAQVDKWEMARTEPGLGRGNLGSEEDLYDNSPYFTALFTVEDAVQHRRILGIGQVNLSRRSVDFFPLGPAPEQGGRLVFAATPDRKRGYILYQAVDNYQMWLVDLAGKRVLRKIPFDGRPRMALRTSTNGKVLYIFEAGNTIDMYDAEDFKFIRTITLDTDMTYNSFHVVPPRGSAGPTSGRH